MVAERRDYVALDWVAAELTDTLSQAATALNAYLENPDDTTQLRFCLAYTHQVYGTLKMVEFAGAALLAEEIETTAHAVLTGSVPAESRADALAALKTALARLPAYLQQLQKERTDRPTALLALINDLRALRNDTLITESAIFSPTLLTPHTRGVAALDIPESELTLAVAKLRQMYQMAMLNYLRNHEPRENLNYLAKVCARLAKLAGGLAAEELWKVAIALFEGLLNRSIALTPAVKSLLQQIDNQLRAVSEQGSAALRQNPPPGLLKNLLYYIAASSARTRFITEVKQTYRLAEALPEAETPVDADALRAVKAALSQQLEQLAEDLDADVNANYGVLLLAELRRAQDTTALLGLNRAQLLLHDVAARLQSQHHDFNDLLPALRSLAADLAEVVPPTPAKTLFNDSEEAQEQLDKAFDAVLLESRNGLEQAKEAIIEFVANQWKHQYLEEVPTLLASVRGGLLLAGLDRAANVLAACENYVRQDLLSSQAVPAWQLLDTLADAIASVDYYLERRAEGSDVDVENIIEMAEDSVAALGYPTDGRIIERPVAEPSNVIPFPTPQIADTSERYDDQMGLGEDGSIVKPEFVAADESAVEAAAAETLPVAAEIVTEPAGAEAVIAAAGLEPEAAATSAEFVPEPAFAPGEEPDPEIAEIFVEEAGEVLTTIDDYLPQWREYPADAESLAVIRRAFHTLKGSGRMVGARHIGELAWSIENMLNRVIDGTLHMDQQRVDAVIAARGLVPAMVTSFERRLLPDMRPVQPLIEHAYLLSRVQTPEAAAPVAAAPAANDLEVASAASAIDFETADLTPAEDIPVLAFISDIAEDPESETEASTAGTEFDLAPESLLEPEAVPADDDWMAAADLIDAPTLEIPAEEPAPFESDFSTEAISTAEVVPEETSTFDSILAFEEPAAESAVDTPETVASALTAEPPLVDDVVDFTEPTADSDFTPVETHSIPAFDTAAEAEEDEEDSDRVLLEIFASEASTHLQTLEEFLRGARDSFNPVELDDHLQRALHTLKGSAQMAGVTPIAAIITPVEHLIKELRAAQLRADTDVLELLDATTDLLRAGLAQLDTTPYEPLAGTDEWPARVAMIYHVRLDQPGATETATGAEETYSPALLNQFLSDAIELISAVADDLRLWQDHQLVDERQHTLAATLSQVADSAEVLNISAVGELAQALQMLLRRAAMLPQPDADFFELAAMASDRLIDMLDRLAANQEPQADDSLLALLQEFEFAAPESLEPPLLDMPVQPTQFAADVTHAEVEAATPNPTIFADSWQDAFEPALENFSFDIPADTSAGEIEPSLEDPAAAAPAWTDSAPTIDVSVDDDLAALTAELEAVADESAAFATEPDSSAPLEADLLAAAFDELGDFADLEETAADDDDHLLAFDELEGETVDLHAAFAQTIVTQTPSNIPGDAVNEYLEAFSAPLPTPLPVVPVAITGSAYDSSDEEIDAEILEIFLEEAVDLLEALDEAVTGWNGDRGNSSYLDELQRLLHTLKGGARLAGLKNLGNLAHNFETLLINAQQQQRTIDDALIAEVQGYQDQLVRMVDAVKSGGHSADADAAVAELEPAAPMPMAPPAADISGAESDNAEPQFEDADADNSDDDGVIVPFVRPTAPRAGTSPSHLSPIIPLGEDIEGLPDIAASTLLRRGNGPQEVVKISAQLLEQLVNLAGETSIARSRSEEQVNEFVFALDEMQITVDRLHEQVRRLDIETEAQVIHRQEQVENVGMEGFDPLEFDRYSLLQQLSRSLLESASDLVDIKNTLADKSRDMETLLVQQARINTELQEGLMRSRMVPFARMVPRLRRIVRQVAGELDKQIDFYVNNAEGELDRTVLERIVAPLEHMLRNAVDHGIEAAADRANMGKSARGTIQLSLSREGGEIVLTLTDDGRGVDLEAVRTKAVARGLMAPNASLSDHEVLQFILESGFSTAKQVTQISGRGVGMDVVASEIKQLGGSLDIDSAWGNGTRFTVRLPFTVSVNRALMVNVGGDIYAIPLNSIEGIVRVSPFELEAYYQPDAPLFEYAGQPYLMRYMGALLRTGDRPTLEGQTMPLPVLLVRGTDHAVAVQVDGLMGSREIVVKTLGPQFGMVHGLSGATVLGDGSVVVILDLLAMIRADAMHLHRDFMLGQDENQQDRSRPLLVMVVDDSVTVRKVTSRFLERQGMEVLLAKDGVDAISMLQESDRVPDVMLLDIEMPRMDGFEVASRIRHTSRWQDLPIIMITSRTGDKHRERAFSLGVNKYLGKPYQEMVLLDTIYELTGTTVPV